MKISEILTKYSKAPDGGHGTDKTTKHSYGPIYDYIFRPYEGREIDLLEVGVRGGQSIAAWREFLPKANICGIDIKEPTDIRVDDVDYIISDVRKVKTDKEYDIVIDDGSHRLEHAIYTVKNFKLKIGGVMIIEDCRNPEMRFTKIKEATNYNVELIDLRGVKGLGDDALIVLRNYGFDF